MRAFLCISAFCLVACATGCRGTSGYVMNESGQAFYDQGNYAMAAQEFQRAIAANPLNADYIANLAAAMKKQGNTWGAEQAWRQALHVNPSHQPSYHGLAQMLVENDRQNDASALLTTWAASQPYAAEPQIEMAWLSREMGNEPLAAQHLKQALQISPNNAKAQAALGQYYQDTGRTAEAITMYQQSLRSDWYQPEVQSRLSTLKGYAAPKLARAMRGRLPRGASTNTAMAFPPAPQFSQTGLAMQNANPNVAMNGPFPGPGSFAYQPGLPATPGNNFAPNNNFTPEYTNMAPQPATVEYPQSQFQVGSPYPPDAFGNVSATTSMPFPEADPAFSTSGQPSPGVPVEHMSQYPPPIPPSVSSQVPNADPAHVPQVSSNGDTEVQAF